LHGATTFGAEGITMLRPSFAATLPLVLVLGCSSAEPEPVATPTYWQDVKPILDGRCIDCHRDESIAPFTLTSYAEARTASTLVARAVADRIMPPWGAVSGHQSYRFDPSLSDEQIATIERWADAGAPEGDPSHEGPALGRDVQTLSRVDLELTMPEAYEPTTEPDEYRCFLLDWPLAETAYVTGFNAVPGDATIDHHIAAFLIRPDNPLGPDVVTALEELDAEDAAPGYECFGGPAGDSGLVLPAQQLGQWVPGQGGGDYPAGSGIKVPAGSKVVLQMHYYTGGGTSPDRTRLEMRIDDGVAVEAAFAPWLDIAWIAGGMEIPAGMDDVVHTHSDDPRPFFQSFVADTDVSNGFDVHAVMLHMHKLGVSGTVAIDRVDGSRAVLLEIGRYDFNWQRLYHLAQPVTFLPGDKLTVECRWDNSPENQPWVEGVAPAPRNVNWGEGTGDEMCVANSYISDR
jgi:hypothetical protein